MEEEVRKKRGYSKAQKLATKKYMEEKCRRWSVTVPLKEGEAIARYCARSGISVNRFFRELASGFLAKIEGGD